jgi:outer membrane protein assembly factor BamB
MRRWLWWGLTLLVILVGLSVGYVSQVNRSHPAPWPMAGGGAGHRYVTPQTLPKAPEVLWTYPLTDAETVTAPVVWLDGTVYIGKGRQIEAVGPDGKRKWLWSGSGIVLSLALGRDGTLYADDGENVLALSPEGKLVWSVPVESHTGLPLVVGDGGVIYAAGQQYLYAISSTGRVKWRFEGEAISAAPVEAPGGRVLVMVADELYLLDRNGETVWSRRLEQPVTPMSLAVAEDGTVYLRGRKQLWAVNSRGQVIAEVQQPATWGWNLAVGDDFVWDGVIRLDRATHRVQWRPSGPRVEVIAVVSDREGNSLLWPANAVGSGLALEAPVLGLINPSGELLWHRDDIWMRSPAAVGADGRVYLAGHVLVNTAGQVNREPLALICIGDPAGR